MNVRYITWGVLVAAVTLVAILIGLVPIYTAISNNESELNACTKELSTANASLGAWCAPSPVRFGVCDGVQTVCVCGSPEQIIEKLSSEKE